jgi:hypothetical protein
MGLAFGGVFCEIEREEDDLGTELFGNVGWHGASDAIFSGFVVGCCQDSDADAHWDMSVSAVVKDVLELWSV